MYRALANLPPIRAGPAGVPYIRDSLVEVAPGEKFSTCLKGKKILDVGCGPGLLSEALAKLGAEVTGVDTNRELIEMAQNHSSKNKRLADNLPSYIWSDIEEHSIACAEKYDAIVVSEVIEHVSEKELFVESCVRAAKPGGKLFFTTPSRTRFAQFLMIFIFEDVMRNFPKGAHQYDKFMRPSELQYMLEMSQPSSARPVSPLRAVDPQRGHGLLETAAGARTSASPRATPTPAAALP
ncbi:jg25980 [Pararge aegeria aegeria]|uniref:Jg25980 protein n=1 Tax=Pararge aegeria aegeria TaxID=348720 RepID=A0A8S4RGS6_9NEOP|nr:jg25980 [Pararge aegeria aegeria]